MEVALRLVLRDEPTRADAFLLFADAAGPLVAACAQLGGEPPAVFAVRGGFVLVPASQESRHIHGTIRLRRLAADLFIPADAELIPALLPDEAAALTQKRGLVILPSNEVLAFAPEPLTITKWLAPVRVRRGDWQSFPQRPYRPDTLSVIERPSPPAALLEILGAGAPDDADPIGSGEGVPEDARPPAGSGSAFGKLMASTNLAIGGLLAWVGKQIGSSGLAKFGGNLARKAIEAVPRLSEKVLGDQEAALREVLRQLQSGDIEKGLRRAPIAVADPNQPARIGTNAHLGNRDPRYSLRDLIGSGGGAATAWLGGGDIWNELAREYRRLAEEATKRGDFRRAAYLYGVLLRDLRSAANVLMAGGLCRDAALIFRDKLNDPLAAADAFERAGDHDEALRLFEKFEHFEKAAELCRRIGDEDRAIAFYIRAAALLAKRGHLLGAGELIRTKAGRRDLAIGYFRRGWEGITAENVTCGERLLDEHLVAEDLPAVKSLLVEAEGNLAERASEAGHFFNYALRVGVDFLPAEVRDDLSDRVRLMFAAHLRTTGSAQEGVRLANELFGRDHPWPGPVVRDAGFAVSKKERPTPAAIATRAAHPPPVKLADGTVTAVCVARGTHDVVVATTEAVVLWRVTENRIVPVLGYPPMIRALSVDAAGTIVFALGVGTDSYYLRYVSIDASGKATELDAATQYEEEVIDDYYLQPMAVSRNDEYRVTVAVANQRRTFTGSHLKCSSQELSLATAANTLLLIESEMPAGNTWEWSGDRIHTWTDASIQAETEPHSWRWNQPWTPAEHRLRGTVDWLTPEQGMLTVAGIDCEGILRWAIFDASSPNNPTQRLASASGATEYVAACLTGQYGVAAVTNRNEVQWFTVVVRTLEVTATVKLDVPTPAVAIVARPAQNEVVVILADGHAIRVRRP